MTEEPFVPVLAGKGLSIKQRYSRFGWLFVINQGITGTEFRVCKYCGLAEPAPFSGQKREKGGRPPAHKNPLTGGGVYIEGSVDTGGGDYVGRDQHNINISNVTGSTLTIGNGNVVNAGPQGVVSVADLAKLVNEMRALAPQLDEDTRDIVQGDFQVVETQLAKPEPKKEQVLLRLKTIAETLGTAVAAGEAAQKLAPMLQQAIAWAQTVLK